MHNKRLAIVAHAIVLSLAIGQAFAQSTRARLPIEVPSVVQRSMWMGRTDPNRVLHMAVSLPVPGIDNLEAFADSVSDPKSRNYRQFITPLEVGERFGLTLDKVNSVANYLKGQGMTVTLVAQNRMSILVTGTVAQAEKAFNTTIDDYVALNPREPGNTSFFANSKPLEVPTTVSPYIRDVTGLENFTKPQHRALTVTQARTLYNEAPMYSGGYQGQNRNLAISNFDGYKLSNVTSFYSTFGLPTPSGGVGSNIHVVTVSGGNASTTPQAEGDLDIQMVLGMAPLCNFYLYDGGSSDLIGTLTKEANDNIADVISESYGWNLPATSATSAHNEHLSMTSQGITYMAASGDSGTTLEPYSYPNYEPEVLMVGGNTATTDSSGNRTSEVAWPSGGGGWSTNTASFNVRPSWQTGNGVPASPNFRLSPDVALHAGGSAGAYQFYFNGSLTSGYNGTSFASPVFCGALGVTEQRIIAGGGLPANSAGKQRFGRIQNVFYAQNGRSDVWYDITSGSNGTLPDGTTSSAHAGWDYCSGWGAINFNAFASTQIPAGTVPSTPTGVSASAGNGQVTISWSASSGATSYNVKRATTSGGPYTTIASPTGTTYTNTGLTNGTTYYYVVSAVNSSGESSNSTQVSATPTAGTVQQLLGNPGFETGTASPWTMSAGVLDNSASEPAHSGSWKAWLDGYGTSHTDSILQTVTIPSTITTATLSFWLHIDTSESTTTTAYDTLKVQIRNSSGTVLTTLATYSNLNAASGYTQKSFNVAAYKGQTIQVYLVGTEDTSLQTSFVVDDFALNVQ